MPCNPPSEFPTCCQTGCTVSDSTFDTFLRCKPTAVLLDLGTLSNEKAIGVPFDHHIDEKMAINNVSIITCLANPLRSVIADEIIVDSGSAFHVISEDLLPPELSEHVIPLDRKVRCATVNGPIVIDKGIMLNIPSLEVVLPFLITKRSPPIISMGKLCRENGFSPIWINAQDPYLPSPTGQRCNLTIKEEVQLMPSAEHNGTTRPTIDDRHLQRAPTSSLQLVKKSCSTQTDLTTEPVPRTDTSGGYNNAATQQHNCPTLIGQPNSGIASNAHHDHGCGLAPHTCSGYATTRPEVSTRHGELENHAEDIYDLAPNGDYVIRANAPKTKIERLKLEANTTQHKLLHYPANPFCRACRIASMKKHAACAHEHHGEEPKEWGDHAMIDHFITRNDESLGIDKEKASLIACDEWSEELDVFPTAAKDTHSVRNGVNQFSGPRPMQG